jgi:pyrroline-5-carboxylate reductase
MKMALRNEKIAVIGCGAMGEAMVKGVLREGFIDPTQVTASNPRAGRCAELADRYGIRTTTDNAEAVRQATMVMIAVKPQYFDEVVEDLKPAISSDALVLTIVAGIQIRHVVEALGTAAVVRIMPNTPGQIGRGISVWTASDAVDERGRERTSTLLKSFGVDEFVSHENELDMATALSGTGPAYVFLIMEALVDAGVHMGFSRRRATKLVYETVRGSVEYAASSHLHPAELRDQVTSPGGTSAEAKYQLEKGRIRTVLSDGVWAAYRRCVELGQAAEDLRINGNE